jgi:SAM-dependent methyltransferase
MTKIFSGPCPVCGGNNFTFSKVLWPELISVWQLSSDEVDYIDRQQGYSCVNCGNNLRSMALALAVVKAMGKVGSLSDFCVTPPTGMKIIEINSAGNLTSFFQKVPGHKLITYPEYDITNLPDNFSGYDLVIHSDTLEHVSLPIAALSECRRILKPSGRCIFTVPLVVERLTRSRIGLPKSYHGLPDTVEDDFIVHTEFGADVWLNVLQAGFSSCTFHCLEYPSAMAIEAQI